MESSEPRCSRGGEADEKRGMNNNWAKFVLRRTDTFFLFLCLSHTDFHSYCNSEVQFIWQTPHGDLSEALQGWATSQERFRGTRLARQSPKVTKVLAATYLLRWR